MKRIFGVAAFLAIVGTGALNTTAMAQCSVTPGTGPMVILNTATFAYETGAAVTAPYVSTAGNGLNVVGLVQSFCSPFLDLNALMPASEFTVVYTGLTSLGTTHPLSSVWTTNYGSGTFAIYQDTPPNAPTTAAGMPAPGASPPSSYTDGTLILSGTITGFNITANSVNASYVGTFTFTGGSLYSRVAGTGGINGNGNVCISGCLPPVGGYSGQLTGKIDNPGITAAAGSTWGALKILYR
jgi:hypothetical protein